MRQINNRDSTRHNFKPKMWIKLLRPNQALGDFKMYRLIDISRGGLSFITNSPDEFKRKHIIYILEVEDKKLDKPLKAVVRYVRQHDEFNIDFKVGIEFFEK